jgi:hypothetical protein
MNLNLEDEKERQLESASSKAPALKIAEHDSNKCAGLPSGYLHIDQHKQGKSSRSLVAQLAANQGEVWLLAKDWKGMASASFNFNAPPPRKGPNI